MCFLLFSRWYKRWNSSWQEHLKKIPQVFRCSLQNLDFLRPFSPTHSKPMPFLSLLPPWARLSILNSRLIQAGNFFNPWAFVYTTGNAYRVCITYFFDCSVDTPTEKRVRKWELSLEDLVLDPLGVKELMEYMKKEYSHENLRFWLAVQELRYGPGTEAKIKKKVKEIWE